MTNQTKKSKDYVSSKKHKSSFPQRRASRFLRLGSLTGRVSGSYIAEKIREQFIPDERIEALKISTHIKNAQRIARTMGQLKGAVMKVGQMMSLQADLLPREFTSVLQTLQKDAPPVDFDVIAKQLKRQYGCSHTEVFETFDEEPYASASIGQIHKATIAGGKEVVAKVQYPGVDKTIKSDLANLRAIIKLTGFMGHVQEELLRLFQEVKKRLEEEIDYRLEAKNLQTFATLFRDDPRVKVPKVYEEYSTRRVLVMEFLEADDLDTVSGPSYSQKERDLIGYNLVDIYLKQVFEFGQLHADPHPGNYNFSKDGTIILYDFGCVKKFPEDFINAYKTLLCHGYEGHINYLNDDFVRLGIMDKTLGGFSEDVYRPYVEVLRLPFLPPDFDFGKSTMHTRLVELTKQDFLEAFDLKAQPHLVFLHRALIGHYNNLRRLKAKAPYHEIFKRYVLG